MVPPGLPGPSTHARDDSERNHPACAPVVEKIHRGDGMRRVALLLCFMVMTPLAAQERSTRVHRFPPDWSNALPQYEKRVQLLTASIKRDAFIISRVTLAMNDLADEFQKLSAIEKAHDRIVEATLRAGQDPKASMRTL